MLTSFRRASSSCNGLSCKTTRTVVHIITVYDSVPVIICCPSKMIEYIALIQLLSCSMFSTNYFVTIVSLSGLSSKATRLKRQLAVPEHTSLGDVRVP